MTQTATAAVHPVPAAGNSTLSQEEKEKKRKAKLKKNDLIAQLIAAGVYEPGQTVGEFCSKLHRYICDRTVPEHIRHFHAGGDKAEFEVLGCHSVRREQVRLMCHAMGKDIELDLPMSGIREAYATQVS